MKLMSKMVHVIWRKFLFCRKSFMEIAQIFDLQITLWKLRKFTITHFWQKFRESNVFTKEPIWRKKVRENFAVFHTHSDVLWKNEKLSLEKKFRQINYLVISLVKPLLSRNFSEKSVRKQYSVEIQEILSLTKIFLVKSTIYFLS